MHAPTYPVTHVCILYGTMHAPTFPVSQVCILYGTMHAPTYPVTQVCILYVRGGKVYDTYSKAPQDINVINILCMQTSLPNLVLLRLNCEMAVEYLQVNKVMEKLERNTDKKQE